MLTKVISNVHRLSPFDDDVNKSHYEYLLTKVISNVHRLSPFDDDVNKSHYGSLLRFDQNKWNKQGYFWLFSTSGRNFIWIFSIKWYWKAALAENEFIIHCTSNHQNKDRKKLYIIVWNLVLTTFYTPLANNTTKI